MVGNKCMKSIVFIIPYYGKFPNYFQLWLNSCATNPSVDWLIITDIDDKFDYPCNVKVWKVSFDKLHDYIQSKYDFPIGLRMPYKFCDFRPAYGDIFQEFINQYDYWGHCDLDLIWGNIRKFLNDDILSEDYDKVFNWGHCTLYRNTNVINNAYRKNIDGLKSYREILQSPCNYAYDESYIVRQFSHLGFKIYDNVFHYDTRVKNHSFQPSLYSRKFSRCANWVGKSGIFRKTSKGLFFCYVDEGVKEEELLYAHFQKRKMDMQLHFPYPENYCIIPNNFVRDMVMTTHQIMKMQPKELFYSDYWEWWLRTKVDIAFNRPRVVMVDSKMERLFSLVFRREL